MPDSPWWYVEAGGGVLVQGDDDTPGTLRRTASTWDSEDQPLGPEWPWSAP